MVLDDTIVAIATPPGRGGIGVVRLAGACARAIAAPLLRLPGADGRLAPEDFSAGRARLAELIEPQTNERLDEVVVTFFARPHSYTTDDIVEISAHGAPVILRRLLELTIERGARLAEPGEFTMRAFLNGRLDLTQAEAVRDLIDSQTLYQAKVAAQQLEGALSHRLQPIKKKLVDLIATLEAGIDFADDDVPVAAPEKVLAGIAAVREPLQALEKSFAYGKLVHEGLTLAIVGRPNVGKSSVFNRLVERERAIVTATPGTTRDLVSETVAVGGIPVRLVDTAGIRHAQDEAESIGVRKSLEALADADLVLVVLDASQPRTREDEELLAQVQERQAIVVENKCDLVAPVSRTCPELVEGPAVAGASTPARDEVCHETADRSASAHNSHLATPNSQPTTHNSQLVSALTGDGIPELRAVILERMSGRGTAQQESGFLTNVRHENLVHDSLSALNRAEQAVHDNLPHEMLLLDLYNALRPLDEITGATTADDILNLIFSSFCIGK